jgi:hypothetical protein
MTFRVDVVLLLMSSMSSKNAFLSIFPLYSGTEKNHWGLDPVNREGVPAVISLLAKNSLTESALIQTTTFSTHQNTKTHSGNSEKDCHRPPPPTTT